MNMTPNPNLPWTTVTVTEFPRTGTVKPGSMRVVRTATPPPPAEENWPRRQTFSGPLTRIRVLLGESSAYGWATEAGTVIEVPRQQADFLIQNKRARLARPDERLTNAPIE